MGKNVDLAFEAASTNRTYFYFLLHYFPIFRTLWVFEYATPSYHNNNKSIIKTSPLVAHTHLVSLTFTLKKLKYQTV